MEKDADKYLTDAEENKDIQLLATSNKLGKAVKVNIAKIKTLEVEIQNLEKKAERNACQLSDVIFFIILFKF